MPKHSDFSPSASERWLECTKSYLLSKDIKQEPSKYAEEGIFAHSVLEYYIKHKKIDYSLVALSDYNYKEMIPAIEISKEYLDNLIKDSKLVLIEKLLPILKDLDIYGTVDYLIIKGDTLHVADFKYGKGKKVNVENNPQLKLYAFGSYTRLKLIADITRIQLHIIQPRINKNGSFISCQEDIEKLEYWVKNTVIVKAKEALNGGRYKDGRWCWFCPAKEQCVHLISKDYAEDC